MPLRLFATPFSQRAFHLAAAGRAHVRRIESREGSKLGGGMNLSGGFKN